MYQQESKTYKGVHIPATADGWELYDKPGKESAARDLYTASTEAVDMISNASLSELEEVKGDALQHIYKVCEQHSKLGAADSEGFYHARHVVIDAFKNIAGITVDPWSL